MKLWTSLYCFDVVDVLLYIIYMYYFIAGPFQAILGKGPWPKLGKKIDLTSKLGETIDIEQYKGSKIYTQNQVILDCIMPSIPLKH